MSHARAIYEMPDTQYDTAVEHLVLIDGHHLMYRAYYAIPKTLRTSKGEQTNAVFGVASMLLTMLRAEEPDRLLFCFDAGEETFRHQENATYKDGRAETPDDFYAQIPRIMQLVEICRLQHVSDPQFEADDLLCSYAKAGEEAGMRVTIVTGDRDVLQLATAKVRIAIPHKGYQAAEYLGPAEILAKYGVRPDQIPSYKGLCGDSSDNLPGVKGIGPKTAAELLQRFDTLAGIYEHLADTKPTVRAKLEHDKEQAFFCEHMAQLICTVHRPHELDALRLQGLSANDIANFFREMEFTSLVHRLESLSKTPYGLRAFQQMSALAPSSRAKTADQMTLF